MIAEMPTGTSIGRRIRELRKSRGWTLDELAVRAEISRSYLSRIETGYRRISQRHIAQLAKTFGIDVEELQLVAREDMAVMLPPERGIPVLNRDEHGIVIDWRGADPVSLRPTTEFIERDPSTQGDDLVALIAVGDYMAPEIMEGDYVIMRPMNSAGPGHQLRSGESVVWIELNTANAKDRSILGRYVQRTDGSMELHGAGIGKKPRPVDRGKIAKISVVVQVRRHYR